MAKINTTVNDALGEYDTLMIDENDDPGASDVVVLLEGAKKGAGGVLAAKLQQITYERPKRSDTVLSEKLFEVFIFFLRTPNTRALSV